MIHNYITYLSVLLIAFSFPLHPRFNSLPFIILIANWIFEGQFFNKWERLKSNWRLYLPFLLFYSLYLTGLTYSSNLDYGLFDIQVKLSIGLFPLILATTSPLPKKWYRYSLFAFIIGGVIAMLIGLGEAYYSYQTSGIWQEFYYFRLSNLIHPVYLSMYLNFAIGIVGGFFIKSFDHLTTIKRWGGVVLILFFVISIYLLNSKIGIIALIATLLILSVTFVSIYKYYLRASIVILCLSIGLTIFFQKTSTRLSHISIHLTFLQKKLAGKEIKNKPKHIQFKRLKIWPASIQLIQTSPLFGVGTGDVRDELRETYKAESLDKLYHHYLNAHNQYIQTTIALGLVGVISFLYCLFSLYWEGYKRQQYSLILFVITIAIFGFTESILERQMGTVFFGFFSALLLFGRANK